jgi:LAO/AO transport system kinase
MKYSDEELVAKILKRDFRAIARMITRIESANAAARALAARMRRHEGRAHVIGITGAPGAGKSTLVDQLTREYRSKGKSVAIVAVDPSSPFSGGAILGDRIRMNHASEDPGVFIRSMATRGSLGGLSKTTLEAVHVLDCAGFDIIIVETVGVGQAEVDIVRTADTCCVILVPGMGDSVQIIKAGLIEIADVFVINKADRDGAHSLEKDLFTLLSLGEFEEGSWKPRVARTIATTGEGVGKVVSDCDEHRAWLEGSSEGYARRLKVVAHMIISMASERIAERALHGSGAEVESLARECVARALSPLEAVERLIEKSEHRRCIKHP